MDGASEYRIFIQVVMPLVKPAWLTLLILMMQMLWERMAAVLSTVSSSKRCITPWDRLFKGNCSCRGRRCSSGNHDDRADRDVCIVAEQCHSNDGFIRHEGLRERVLQMRVKSWLIVLAASLLIAGFGHNQAHAAPYEGYTYNYWGDAVKSPIAFLPSRVITGDEAGTGACSPRWICMLRKMACSIF